MPTPKPFRSFEDQADLIIDRGCSGERFEIVEKLRFVNYYRLSGYLYPFRKIDANTGKKLDEFKAGTSFSAVWDTYRFDRRLRFLLLDAIERLEIALRTQIAHTWAKSTLDSFGRPVSNPQASETSFSSGFTGRRAFIASVQGNYEASETDCAKHHRRKGFEKVEDLPVWVFVEFTTIGNLTTLFRHGLPRVVAEEIANSLNFPKNKMASALALIREARNACAHHNRVWNREWIYEAKDGTRRPMAPSVGFSVKVPQKTTANLLLICEFLLNKIAPNSSWKKRVLELFKEIPLTNENLKAVGFSPETFDVWKNS